MSGRVRGPSRAQTGETGSASWWHAADLAVLGAMIVLGSVLLVPAYGTIAPVLATATGAVVAAGVAALVYRFRMPGVVAVVGIAAGVVVSGGIVVAPGRRTFGVLPSGTGMTTVLGGVIGGWRELLTVATPTGVVGALLVPPLLVGAVVTALSGVVAASRRPALALLGPAAALVLFALLGSQLVAPATAAAVGGLSLIAGMSWAVWVGSRGRRRVLSRGSGDPTVDGNRAAAARSAGAVTRHALAVRRIGISIAVLAVAVSVGTLTATAVTPQRTALRDLVELPLDPTAFVSPLSTFRSYTKDQADVPQLTVSGLPAGARLRLAALDAYDGRHFVVSDAEGPFVRIGRERPQTSADQPVTVNVHIQNFAGSFLPLPGPIAELDFGGPRAAQLTQDLRYSESAATGLLPGGWQPGDTYSVLATVPAQPGPEQLAAAQPTPATVPTTVALPDMVRSAANRYVGGVTGAGRQVEAIRAGLAADGVFSDGGPGEPRSAAGHGLDRMAAMITGSSMVGDQEQYAALMALLVRSIGLPARVVVGFVPPPLQTSPASAGSADSASSDDVEVRGRDISAWVEVPFDGYGWVAFDPSPKPGKSSPDTQPPSSTGRGAVTVVVPPALPQSQPDTVNGENANQRPDVADPKTPTAAADSGWLGLVLTIVGWTAAVLALLALPVAIILGLKAARRRRRRRAERPEDRITGGWEQLLDTAVDTGYRPRPWHTRTEMAADLRSAGVLQVDWLAPAADAADFSPGPVLVERAAGYWREVDDRSAELLGGLPLWRRWRARVSLASVRRADLRRPAVTTRLPTTEP